MASCANPFSNKVVKFIIMHSYLPGEAKTLNGHFVSFPTIKCYDASK